MKKEKIKLLKVGYTGSNIESVLRGDKESTEPWFKRNKKIIKFVILSIIVISAIGLSIYFSL